MSFFEAMFREIIDDLYPLRKWRGGEILKRSGIKKVTLYYTIDDHAH